MSEPSPLAEAPVSITAHILVPAISKDPLLVTGRGATAREAAMNLRQAIAAVREMPQPARLSDNASPIARLAPLIAARLQRDLEWEEPTPSSLERTIKAAAIVLSDGVKWDEHTLDAIAVRSMGKNDLWYTCIGTSCSCPDWANHKTQDPDIIYFCKHMIAALWWRQVREK